MTEDELERELNALSRQLSEVYDLMTAPKISPMQQMITDPENMAMLIKNYSVHLRGLAQRLNPEMVEVNDD